MREDYILPIRRTKRLLKKKNVKKTSPKKKNEDSPKLRFLATVTPGKKLQLEEDFLKKGHKYRINLNPYALKKPKFPQATPLGFRLVGVKDVEAEAAAAKEVQISSPKSFIKNM